MPCCGAAAEYAEDMAQDDRRGPSSTREDRGDEKILFSINTSLGSCPWLRTGCRLLREAAIALLLIPVSRKHTKRTSNRGPFRCLRLVTLVFSLL